MTLTPAARGVLWVTMTSVYLAARLVASSSTWALGMGLPSRLNGEDKLLHSIRCVFQVKEAADCDRRAGSPLPLEVLQLLYLPKPMDTEDRAQVLRRLAERRGW